MEDDASSATPALSCRLIGPDLAARKSALVDDLFVRAERVEELPDGYAWRFAVAERWLPVIAEFVAIERQCCPFFRFEIVLEPDDGPIWLCLRGGEQVKAFIQEELNITRTYTETPQ